MLELKNGTLVPLHAVGQLVELRHLRRIGTTRCARETNP